MGYGKILEFLECLSFRAKVRKIPGVKICDDAYNLKAHGVC
jgi:hypothetical protein